MVIPSRATAEKVSTEDIHDDVRERLPQLRHGGEASLISQIFKVQHCQLRSVRPFEYWRNVTFLSTKRGHSTSSTHTMPTKTLYRSKCPLADGKFVAVSYRLDKTCPKGGFSIAAGYQRKEKTTDAPDEVLARVVKYVDHFDLPAFWIDQECIEQRNSNAKELATQSMDLVYQCSKRPLGVLTIPLHRQEQLNLLHELLHESIVTVNDGAPRLACWAKYWTVRKLLNLLEYLLTDSW